MDVARYLARIGIEGPVTPDAEGLRRLHHAHLLSVPFENLDITRGRPLSLDRGKLFEKIVDKRRGGFCYELNGLFAEALETLGFQVQRLSARVFGRDDGVLGPPRDHLCLRVELADGPRLADVGFGRGFRAPLRFDSGDWQADLDGPFRLVARGEELMLERQGADGGPQPLYVLDPREPLALEAFDDMCRRHQSTGEFTRGPICTIARPEGRDSLRRGVAVRERGGDREERVLESEDQAWVWVREVVGLDVRAPADD